MKCLRFRYFSFSYLSAVPYKGLVINGMDLNDYDDDTSPSLLAPFQRSMDKKEWTICKGYF